MTIFVTWQCLSGKSANWFWILDVFRFSFGLVLARKLDLMDAKLFWHIALLQSVGMKAVANWQIDFEGCTEHWGELTRWGQYRGSAITGGSKPHPNQPTANSHLTLILNSAEKRGKEQNKNHEEEKIKTSPKPPQITLKNWSTPHLT